MHILTVCGMGFGTSLMLLMEIQDQVKALGLEVDGEATDMSSAKGKTTDLVVASSEIAAGLEDDFPTVIGIVNILDKDEIKAKVLPVVKEFYMQSNGG